MTDTEIINLDPSDRLYGIVEADIWKKRALRAEQALQDIKKHMEIVIGEHAQCSATYRIAERALKENT